MQVRELRLGSHIEPELASLAIPGLGQLLQGRLIRAALWFFPTLALWAIILAPDGLGTEGLLIIPIALAMHLASARAAALSALRGESSRPANLWETVPFYLQLKVLGGVLLTVAAFHILIVGTELIRGVIDAQMRWAGTGFLPPSMSIRLGWLIGRLVMMTSIGAIGFCLYQIGSLSQMRATERTREHLLLQEARARGGSLTVPEAAAILQSSFEEAHELLETMAQRRWIGVSIASSGQKQYSFLPADLQDSEA